MVPIKARPIKIKYPLLSEKEKKNSYFAVFNRSFLCMKNCPSSDIAWRSNGANISKLLLLFQGFIKHRENFFRRLNLNFSNLLIQKHYSVWSNSKHGLSAKRFEKSKDKTQAAVMHSIAKIVWECIHLVLWSLLKSNTSWKTLTWVF